MHEELLTQKSFLNQAAFCWSMRNLHEEMFHAKFPIEQIPVEITGFHQQNFTKHW